MSKMITLLVLTIFTASTSTAIHVMEGEVAKLDFLYPCDCSEITLQQGNGSPFYSSANPDTNSWSANKKITNHEGLERKYGNCTLCLEINPVLRIDQGTYILTAYENGQMLPDYPRIWLDVSYHPGKASCELSNDYDDGEWVSLRCTASEGTLSGHIVCYQDGLRQPHLTKPVKSRQTFSQIIVVRLIGLVYCCSSSTQ